MPRVFVLAILASVTGWAAVPTVDKAKLEAYLRYAEGYPDSVHYKIDDPVVSPIPGLYRVMIHLSRDDGAKLDQVYYISQDGEQIINGTIRDLTKSPFAENLSKLPDGGYAFGPFDAKVKLVIFSDFECPFCRDFAKTIRDNIPSKYPKDVRVIFKDFPLDQLHPWARAAAEASHCVGDQNQDAFWEYHDWIFAHATEIKPDTLKAKVIEWANTKKLDVPQLTACMDTHKDAGIVNESEQRGKSLMIKQTPTVFANGREIPGAYPWDKLNPIIQMELKRASETSTPTATH